MPQNTGIEVGNVIDHMKKKGSLKIVVIGFILGLALLLVGSFALKDDKSDGGGGDEGQLSGISFDEYKTQLTREIEEICLGVDGVESVKVAVYFDGVGGSIYAQNSYSGNTEKNEYVIIGSGSDSHALYLGESLPSLSGIGVVCDTGGRLTVRNELSLLLSSLYGLSMTRVYICEG